MRLLVTHGCALTQGGSQELELLAQKAGVGAQELAALEDSAMEQQLATEADTLGSSGITAHAPRREGVVVEPPVPPAEVIAPTGGQHQPSACPLMGLIAYVDLSSLLNAQMPVQCRPVHQRAGIHEAHHVVPFTAQLAYPI